MEVHPPPPGACVLSNRPCIKRHRKIVHQNYLKKPEKKKRKRNKEEKQAEKLSLFYLGAFDDRSVNISIYGLRSTIPFHFNLCRETLENGEDNRFTFDSLFHCRK